MSNKAMSTLTEKPDAAFREAAAKVIELARQTGTPVIVWEDGRIVAKTAEEAEMNYEEHERESRRLRDSEPRTARRDTENWDFRPDWINHEIQRRKP